MRALTNLFRLFVSVLGAQANSHTSIIGDSGSAKNTQLDFLILVEDAIKTLDASNGPVKYQDAIKRTKTRLDFAIARGVLLMPSRMPTRKALSAITTT